MAHMGVFRRAPCQYQVALKKKDWPLSHNLLKQPLITLTYQDHGLGVVNVFGFAFIGLIHAQDRLLTDGRYQTYNLPAIRVVFLVLFSRYSRNK